MRRLSQSLVLLLIAIGAVGAGTFGAIALSYHRFSAEVRTARASMPATGDAMPSPTGALDEPQVILVRGAGTPASGGAVLFRSAPKGTTAAFLSIPGSALVAGEPVNRLDTPRLLRGLRTTLGIALPHVVIVHPKVSGPVEQRVVRATAGRVLAPTSVTQLQGTGQAIAGTSTDLTDADVLGLMWAHLDDRRVVHCEVPGHQSLDSAQAVAVAAAFLAPDDGKRPPGCSARAIAPASFVPPKAFVVFVQDFGTWAFAMIGGAAMLASLGAAALFARRRFGDVTDAAPAPALHTAAPAPAATLRLARVDWVAPAAALAGAGGAIRRALARAAVNDLAPRAALGRAAGAVAAFGRGALDRLNEIRPRVSSVEDAAFPRYRSRARKFAYLHQDALWVGLCATAAAGVLIRLLTS
ncbi:MAG TPA: hypothetical protein VFI18_01325 [Gaiellales bacterium]|nr:hypothetical protein [Gaiellales bacterium]